MQVFNFTAFVPVFVSLFLFTFRMTNKHVKFDLQCFECLKTQSFLTIKDKLFMDAIFLLQVILLFYFLSSIDATL